MSVEPVLAVMRKPAAPRYTLLTQAHAEGPTVLHQNPHLNYLTVLTSGILPPLLQVSQRLVAEFATEADVQEIGSVLRSWLGVLTGAPRKAWPHVFLT